MKSNYLLITDSNNGLILSTVIVCLLAIACYVAIEIARNSDDFKNTFKDEN